MLFILANRIWNIVKWIWLAVIVTFFVGLAVNLSVIQVTELPKILIVNILNWFLLAGINRVLTITTSVLFVLITLTSGVFTLVETYFKGGKVLRKYLHAIVEINQGLNPKGFSQQSQALISVNVPLDEIFIHLNTISDRPVYDMPTMQEELLNHMRQRTDLSAEEREERIQRLRVIWHSQLGLKLAESWRKQNVAIEKMIGQIELALPVAVLLGAPGSGKSTVMRWLALHMAHACLSLRYTLPKGLIHKQIPILLRISDYAKRLRAPAEIT